MKKMMYVISALLLAFTCMIPTMNIKANNVISKVDLIQPYVRVNLTSKEGKQYTSILGYIHANQQLVYCVEPYKVMDSGMSLAPGGLLNEAQRHEISLISYFGYNHKDRKSDKWYMATQLMIWESLGYQFIVEGFDDYANYKNTIVQDKKDFSKLPSFNESQVTLKANETKILNDTNQVFSKYKHVNHKGKASFKKEGNGLHLSSTSNASQEGEVSYQKLSDEELGLPIVYQGASDSSVQSVIYPKIKQNVNGKVRYRVQPYGTFTLQKRGSQVVGFKPVQIENQMLTQIVFGDVALSQVEANIYAKEEIKDVWGNVIHQKDALVDQLVSGSKNKSKLLLAGKYYLKEMKTVEGYVLDSKPYDFTIENNKETIENINFDFVNQRQKVQLQFQKRMEQGSLLELEEAYKDVRFAIYTKAAITSVDKVSIPANTMVYYSGIDAQGQLLEPLDLPLGSYVLKEVKTNKHYELDQNEYPFDVVNNGSETIVVNPTNGELENKLIRKDLTIVKKGDDKKPLQAKFALYNANKEEIMQFTTQEEGTYVIEDLLQGTYFVKELEAPKGYRYSSEMHRIEVEEDTSYTITNQKVKEKKAVKTSDSTNHKPFAWSMIASMTTMYTFLFRKFMKF